MFFEDTNKGVLLRVRISPNSSSCFAKGVFISADGLQYLKINVISVPEKGKANREVIDFLAKKLKTAKSNFEIISGDTDRYKKILIRCDIKEIEDKLESLIREG
ncbi:MAG: DUF167 family protein [Lactobacillaceae bacterium]|jgi:uncharacterized protein (TIGR00251 family)|nr:DUF167 family protein [Lactobacillaceae bacterium]